MTNDRMLGSAARDYLARMMSFIDTGDGQNFLAKRMSDDIPKVSILTFRMRSNMGRKCPK